VVRPLETAHETTKYDLSLAFEETTEGLEGVLVYNTDLFEAATVARMAGHLQVLLSGSVADPTQRLHDLPLLTRAEWHELVVTRNAAQADYPAEQCFHQLFEDQVARTPNATAAVFKDQRLTYHELNQSANQLAHYLQTLGVGPEVRVGICVERSLDMVVG